MTVQISPTKLDELNERNEWAQNRERVISEFLRKAQSNIPRRANPDYLICKKQQKAVATYGE